MIDGATLVSVGWPLVTTLVSIFGSMWAATKLLEHRMSRLEKDHEELEKDVLVRLRSIEVTLAEIRAELKAERQEHRGDHWSQHKEA